MTKIEISKILTNHKKWLENKADGIRADLRNADLRNANLCDADLRGADLRHANLCDADLRHADLRNADLRNANLCDADLRGADLDHSAWSLGCGSLDIKVDKRIAAQLLYHALRAMMSCADEPDVAAVLSSEACLRLANQFHRVDECGEVGLQKKEAENDDKGND